MATENAGETGLDAATALRYVEWSVYALAALLGLSLLVVGAVAIIAAIKGSWHWAIHLESTVSYMGLFVSRLLALLVPLFVVMVVGRRVVDRA